ncbi:hypothetical protein [Peribacillus simplex]|uniref:hypothetical protein n=1 Tax=Peribacillus simplex TaxID=1478 RepID=UPI003D28D03C
MSNRNKMTDSAYIKASASKDQVKKVEVEKTPSQYLLLLKKNGRRKEKRWPKKGWEKTERVYYKNNIRLQNRF